MENFVPILFGAFMLSLRLPGLEINSYHDELLFT